MTRSRASSQLRAARPGRRRPRAPACARAALASRPCPSGCSSTTRSSRASPCTATSCRASMLETAPGAPLPATARSPRTRSATSATISEEDLQRVDRERYSGTGADRQDRRRARLRARPARHRRLPRGARERAGPPREAARGRGRAAQDARSDGGQRPAADDRHRAAARRRRGFRRPARRRRRDRSVATATSSPS